jgi:hypothetical protein
VVSCDKLRGDANDRYIRRFPNGTTQYTEGVLPARGPTQGTETSKYLQEKKINNDSLSSGERTGKSPNRIEAILSGVVGLLLESQIKLNHLERWAAAGDSPVDRNSDGRVVS